MISRERLNNIKDYDVVRASQRLKKIKKYREGEILILTPSYNVKERELNALRLDVKRQMENGGVVILPFGWKVVTKPSDIEVKIAAEPEEAPTPWDFVDNHNHSPFDSQGKERLIFCTKCGINIDHYDAQYQYCPYCGKRHYFENWSSTFCNHSEKPEEEKKKDKEEEVWCTECPYFRFVPDDMDDSWYGAKCNKDGHEANPSMYAVQSLHDDCPLKKEGKSE